MRIVITLLLLWKIAMTQVTAQINFTLKDSVKSVILDLRNGQTRVLGYDLIAIQEIIRLYDYSSDSPLWWLNYQLSNQLDEAINLLYSSYHEGLTPTDYHYEKLAELVRKVRATKPKEVSNQIRMTIEFLLTTGLLSYSHDLYEGKLNRDYFDGQWHVDCQEWGII